MRQDNTLRGSSSESQTSRKRIVSYYNQTITLISLGAFVVIAAAVSGFYLEKYPAHQLKIGFAWLLALSTAILMVLIAQISRTFYANVKREVTELQRSEEKVRAANETLTTLIESSPVGIVSLNAGLTISLWNPAAEKLLGWKANEVKGLDARAVFTYKDESFSSLIETALSGREINDVELMVEKKDGDRLAVGISLAQVHDSEGDVAGIIVILADITERKKAAEAERERKVIAEREKARTQLVQIAAHELRNPLASIKGVLSFVRWRLDSGMSVNDMAKKTKLLEREVDRLSGLLDEVLEAFQMDEGRLALSLEPVELSEVVEAALDPFRHSVTPRRIVQTGLESAWVLGDAKKLEDVVRNLLSNAIKYSPPTTEINVELHHQADEIALTVADEGVGIPPEDIPRVFDGFYRGSNLAGRDPGGLGLGLYICKEIITRHGGRIWVESDREHGTAFHVVLPHYEMPPEVESE